MNFMKKTVCLILAIITLLSLASCTHNIAASEKNGVFTLMVRNENGLPAEGVGIDVCEGSRVIASLTTNTDGKASATMYYGEYILKVRSLPEDWTANEDNVVFNFTKENYARVIEVNTNVPNGKKTNPYIIDGETTISLGSGKSAYYLIKPQGDKNTLYIPAAATLVIKIDGKESHENFRGNISLTVDGETLVVITNNGPGIETGASLITKEAADKLK